MRDDEFSSSRPWVVWKPKPLSALRRPSLLLKSANPTAPPDRTTPQPNETLPKHRIPITYSTVAVRALSFHSQVLTDVTPVQLAQNGLYCKPLPDLGRTACCSACGSLYCVRLRPLDLMTPGLYIHTLEILRTTSETIQSIILTVSRITPFQAFSLRSAQSLPLAKHSSHV